MMKKMFAPPLAKPHVLCLSKDPEHLGKKEDIKAKEGITYPLSQGWSDLTETKLKAGDPYTDGKRWKKSGVGEEEDTGRIKGSKTVRDLEKKAKSHRNKVSKKTCHLTDLHFEEIVQCVLQKSLEECLEESKRTVLQAESSEVAKQQGLVKETLETSLPTGNLVQHSNESQGRVSAGDLKESMPKAKKCSKLSETYESMEANKERRKRDRKGEPKKIVQGYTLISNQEETEEGGGSAFDQCVAWVQCSYRTCEKWRRLSSDVDPSILPEDWTCSQNTDLEYKSCDVPEEAWSGSEAEVAYAAYVPGSIIWAKQFGYPWWPGMVECDPDIGEYFLFSSRLDSFPSKYHVTFFGDSVSRAWISAAMLRNFHEHCIESLGLKKLKNKYLSQQLEAAVKMAKEAEQINIQERVTKFGFISRYSEGGLLEGHEDLEEPVACEPSEEKQSREESENMVPLVLPTSHFKEKALLKENTGPAFGSEGWSSFHKKSNGQGPASKKRTASTPKACRIAKEKEENGRSDTKFRKKKFIIPQSHSSGSGQPKAPAGGRFNLTSAQRDSLNPKLVEMLQVKDSTLMSHSRSYASDEVFEELQEVVKLEKAMKAPGSQEMEIVISEKNESSEDFSQVLFEE